MDESLYDEFGNYIGPELDSDEEEEREEDEGEEERGLEDGHEYLENGVEDDGEDAMETEGAVVLAEDKKYYPTAMEVYGEGVETLVMDEDAQPLEEPIIKPINLKKFEVLAKEVHTHVSTDFLLGLMSNPTLIRNVALIGHLHHGKTLVMDMLFQQTHDVNTLDPNSEKHLRYTDTRIDEQERQISIKTVPMSLVLEDSAGKSYLCNIMDTPGHVNFSDEMTAALRLTDGAVLVVDAVEGVMVSISQKYQKIRCKVFMTLKNAIFIFWSFWCRLTQSDPSDMLCKRGFLLWWSSIRCVYLS
jgi:U5 small nuclear ribonucleoprotein component